ncbi:hypothetical protein V6N13_054084 [Hibiscus sabdariffa]
MEVEDHLIDGRHEWECGKNVNVDWKALFSGTEVQSLKFFLPEILEGSSRVKSPAHVFEDGYVDWKFALVGQFIGSALNSGVM